MFHHQSPVDSPSTIQDLSVSYSNLAGAPPNQDGEPTGIILHKEVSCHGSHYGNTNTETTEKTPIRDGDGRDPVNRVRNNDICVRDGVWIITGAKSNMAVRMICPKCNGDTFGYRLCAKDNTLEEFYCKSCGMVHDRYPFKKKLIPEMDCHQPCDFQDPGCNKVNGCEHRLDVLLENKRKKRQGNILEMMDKHVKRKGKQGE